jgi:poly(A) polymerase
LEESPRLSSVSRAPRRATERAPEDGPSAAAGPAPKRTRPVPGVNVAAVSPKGETAAPAPKRTRRPPREGAPPKKSRRAPHGITQSVVDRLRDSSDPGSEAGLDLPRFEVSDLPADFDVGDLGEQKARSLGRKTAGRPEPCRHAVSLDERSIDQDAAKVVRRLTRAGYEAYLVGGCVRDLLLDYRPKDFDVATSASPEDIRRLFRNSRIIGRRFRLVHVLFSGGKVIETATFRKAPLQDEEREGAELLIRSDNEFGAAHEDARRRDFTFNGLFYDLDAHQVLDWVDGMPDIERRTINTIGDPFIRFQEDPVRILRAIKFAARLDCGIDPHVYDAIVQCRDTLAMAARPRLFEEVLRLLRGGASHRSFFLAWETGVLDVLLPELATFLSDEDDQGGMVWRTLMVTDRITRERREPLSDVVLCGAMLLEPILEICQGSRDRMRAAAQFLDPVIDRLNMPRRIADALRRIAALIPRLEQGRPGRFQRTNLYADTRALMEIRREAAQMEAPRRSVPERRTATTAPPPDAAQQRRRHRRRSGGSEQGS